jgi:hypothetical protein
MKLPDISPTSIDDFANRAKHIESHEFNNHLKWRNANAEVMSCDAQCHSFIFCNFKKLLAYDFNVCVRDTQRYTAAIAFGKRK